MGVAAVEQTAGLLPLEGARLRHAGYSIADSQGVQRRLKGLQSLFEVRVFFSLFGRPGNLCQSLHTGVHIQIQFWTLVDPLGPYLSLYAQHMVIGTRRNMITTRVEIVCIAQRVLPVGHIKVKTAVIA